MSPEVEVCAKVIEGLCRRVHVRRLGLFGSAVSGEEQKLIRPEFSGPPSSGAPGALSAGALASPDNALYAACRGALESIPLRSR